MIETLQNIYLKIISLEASSRSLDRNSYVRNQQSTGSVYPQNHIRLLLIHQTMEDILSTVYRKLCQILQYIGKTVIRLDNVTQSDFISWLSLIGQYLYHGFF